jgi:hypothetical protein
MTNTTSINKIAIEQEQQDSIESSYIGLKFPRNRRGILMKNNNNNKIIGIGAALVLALVVTTTTPSAVVVVYGQGGELFGTDECSRLGETVGGFEEAECKLLEAQAINNATVQNQLNNPRIQELEAQDPVFKSFGDMLLGCMSENGTIPQFQCNTALQSAAGNWCNLEGFDQEKCTYVSSIANSFTQSMTLLAEVDSFLGGLEYPSGAPYP